MPHLQHDVTDLLYRRRIFWELQDVAQHNDAVLSPGDFFDWMCENYVAAVTVGIRRMADRDWRSRNLWRMLFQMLEHPGVLNREQHVRLYRTSPVSADLAGQFFDNVSGGSHCITQRMLRADLRELEDATSRVYAFVNKRIAHHSRASAMRRRPLFRELDAALATFDRLLCKYSFLLTADGTSTLDAQPQAPWQDVLLRPWTLPGSPLHPESD